MTLLFLLPAILSLLALGAHFFRASNGWGLAFVLLLLALLAVRKPASARIVQVALLFGVASWIRTAYRIAAGRTQDGLPWVRMAAILGVVALFTGLSALPFESKRLRAWFRVGEST